MVELRSESLHVPVPEVGHFFSLFPSPAPHQVKVVGATVILRHGDTILTIQNPMPPVAGHEDNIASFLKTLVHAKLRVRSLDPGKDEVKIHDGLVVFTLPNHIFPLDYFPLLLRFKEHPMLAARGDGIPRGCAERVCVHSGTRTAWADAEPPERRPGILVDEGEVVVGEKVRDFVVVHQRPDCGVVIHVRFEEVEGAVILLAPDVVCVVLELHAQLLPLVVLCHLEGDVAETFLESIDGPTLHGRPIRQGIFYDYGPALGGVILVKPLWCDFRALHPGNGHCLVSVLDRTIQDLLSRGVTKLVPVRRFDIRAFALLAAPDLPAGAPVSEGGRRARRRRGRCAARGPAPFATRGTRRCAAWRR
mmetsp:Transcript_2591/g.6020  ORF Transcript_2591/g.6020 Transcript_2591/m.6020 type:complete len:362 (-) Transcript_2591:212-1297(-)